MSQRTAWPILLAIILAIPLAAPAAGVNPPTTIDIEAPHAAPTCDEIAANAIIAMRPPTWDATGNLVIPASHPAVQPCPGIRPGGALVLRAGPLEFVYCSLSFIVTDGTDLYVATAGHCVDAELSVPSVGDRVSALGVPGTFGTVAHQWCEGGDAAGRGCSAGTDFALIRIDADKHSHVNPAMCHWGAPTGGIYTARETIVRKMQHFGWGLLVGDLGAGAGLPLGNPATQARAALVLDSTPDNWILAESASAPGDSGSGALVAPLQANLFAIETAPKALGVITHISLGGLTIVQRLDVSLTRAGTEMSKTFTLVSS